MRAIPYKDALLWILEDQNQEIPGAYLSVTASCVADIYRINDCDLRKDLLKLRKKINVE